MAFQRAILPAVLSWADKLVMIGKYWNTYLIACQCYIYYIVNGDCLNRNAARLLGTDL